MLCVRRQQISGITRRQFDGLVKRVLRRLPAKFRRQLKNIVIVCEDHPPKHALDTPDERLYGLYEGVPLPEQGIEEPMFPARITIFREPLLSDFGHDAAAIMTEVRTTVLHEIGHHFGMDESDLEELEY